MKKAKFIFQILFILIAIFILYFSIDILANTESYLEQLKVSQYRKFPKYVFGTFLILSIVMMFYFVLERWESLSLRRKIKNLTKQNQKLKSQLYDAKEELEQKNQLEAPENYEEPKLLADNSEQQVSENDE